MFTKTLDILLIFMITTPAVGWISKKMVYKKTLGIYSSLGLSITAYFLCEMFHKVVKGPFKIIVNQPFYLFEACLEIDMLSFFMALIYNVIGLVAVVYSIKYMEHDTGITGYYTLLLAMIAGMMGVVFAGDFFTLFVFWELMCLASYALVAFRKQSWEPIEAGFKYLIMSATGGATILLAMSFLYGMTGTLNFAYLASSLSAESNGWLYVVLTLFIIGFGIKAAIVPFHTWLPDAHSAAPSPISGVLSGVMVKTGVYAIIRIVIFLFSSIQPAWRNSLAILAILTMSLGNLMTILQDDVKRLLAFSTIVNVGYIVFGVAIGSQRALTGCLFHVLNHAIVKSLLFICAGSIINQTKTRSLNELEGIRHSMPITSTLFVIGTIALMGIPPLNFFWSELTILMAGLEADMFFFSIFMIINVVFSAAYCLRLIQAIMLKDPTSTSKKASEVSILMLIPQIVLAVFCIIIGFYPKPFLDLTEGAARSALDVQDYINA